MYKINNNLPLDTQLFEKVMVYNALLDPLYLESIVEYAKPSYFSNKDIRSVFESLSQYYTTFKKVPNVTELKVHLVEPEKRQALKNVALSFSDIDKKYDKDVLLLNTEKFLKEKAVLNTVIKTSVDVNSGAIDSSKILKDFEEACGISLVEKMGFDYFESIEEHCNEIVKVSKTLSTGWKWLDTHIGGGFAADGRALYVFFGVTNVGKSIFLGNVALNLLKQDKTVVLISLEMSEHMYSKRFSATISQVDSNQLPTNVETVKKGIYTYKNRHSGAKLVIKEFPPQTATTLHLKNYIERLVRKGIKPDAIVIDYVNLIAPIEKGKGSYESIKAITEQLRAMSYAFECPVISATQTNREGYNVSNPGLETMSESMGLAHTADAQFSIWSEEGDRDLGIIHLGIKKNRFGPIDVNTVLEIDYPTYTLRDPDAVTSSFKTERRATPSAFTGGSVLDTLNAIENVSDIDEI